MNKRLNNHLVLVTAFLLWAMNVNCQNKIDQSFLLEINGISQYFEVNGEDDTKPLMLFIHGGPGRSLIPFADGFTSELQKHFIVAQWDQRETGKTREANTSNEKLTLDLMNSDALMVAKELLKRYSKQKLYIVSHSWGSHMGYYLATVHPEMIAGYFAISPIINQNRTARKTIKYLKKWAKRNNNNLALSELKKVKTPFTFKEDLFYSQKWLFIHNGVDFAETPEFKRNYYQWMDTWFDIWLKSTPRKASFYVRAPIYIFEGNADGLPIHTITQKYFKKLKAPKKELIWMTNSGHTIFNTEPQELQQKMINMVYHSSNK